MSRETSRPEDMSPDGRLDLIWQDDGDIIVVVKPTGHKGFGFDVEFCNSGGHSDHTLKALHNLFEAMERDNRERPEPR